MRRYCVLFALLMLALPVATYAAPDGVPVRFQLGFATMASQVPDVVGTPIENEHHSANGDGLQLTTTGLMVWRKADNWTAFTNGSMTWVNGPYGVQERSNDARFPWEYDDRGQQIAPVQASALALPDPAANQFDAAVENAALGMLNASRAQFGVAPLVMDPTLRSVARGHSKDMGDRNYFAHVTPDGKSPLDRMAAAGIHYTADGENIGMSKGIPSTLDGVRANHNGMMAETPPDDGHRVNILNRDFVKVGIGVYRTADGRVYYTCDFTN